MPKPDVYRISNIDRDFICKAIREEQRIDGRSLYSLRKLRFEFGLDDHSATVLLGSTRVMAVIAAELEAPYPDKPNEGSIRFYVEFSPMASEAFEAGKPGEEAIEVARLVERALKQSGAVDAEALCVVAGRKAWSLRVDVHVLDHDGNLVDACCLAALAALMALRLPQVTVGGEGGEGQIVVHSPDVREPLPLSIHHLPVAVSFSFFEDGNVAALDPCLREEAAQAGGLTLVMNPHGEVCAVQKADGVGITVDQLQRCMRLACARVEDVVAQLKQALQQHELDRVTARVRRHRPAAPRGAGARQVALLQSDDVAAEQMHRIMRDMKLKLEGASSSSSSSSSSSDEDEEMQEQQQQGSGQQRLQPASTSGRTGDDGSGKPGPKLVGAGFKLRKEAPAARAVADTKAGVTSSKRRVLAMEAQQYDDLEAISAIIAGATGAQQAVPVTDLSQAVKPQAAKRQR